MTLQFNRKALCITRLILPSIFLTAVSMTAVAQATNTFPNTGNAGIGTTTPAAPLEINKNQNAGTNLVMDNGYTSAGNAAYSGFWFRQSGANRFFVGSNNDGNTTQTGGAGAVQFWNFINAPVLFATNNSERLRISGAGHVGIGTTAPNVRLGQKLDIAASGDYSGAVFSTWSSSSAASLLDLNRSKSNTIGIHSAVANNDLLGVLSGRGTDGTNFLTASQVQFWVDGSVSSNVVPGRIVFNVTDASGTAADAMTIKSSGNVGIGTTSPQATLHVQRDTNGDASLHLLNANTGASSRSLFLLGEASSDAKYGYLGYFGANYTGWANSTVLTGAGAGGLRLYSFGGLGQTGGSITFNTAPVGNNGAVAERMRIDGNGNVGLGTTSPSDPLQIDSAAGWAMRLRYTGNNYYLRLSANQVSAYTASNVGSNLFLNVDGGNVGIGTTTPAYKLDVAGAINATGLNVNGSPVSGTQWGTSGANISYNSGNVGIGTTSPSAKLEVASNSAIKLGNAYFSSGGDYVHLANNEWYNGTSWTASAAGALIQISGQDVNFYRHDAAGAHTQSLNINSSGNVGIGTTATSSGTGNLNVLGTIEAGNIKAKYQDVAEWVPSSEQLAAGTVVVLDTTKSNQVIASASAYDTRVAGVISAQPGITLGESGEGKVLVATTGRVRVKVDASRGAIQIGDLLVTSDVAGVAMKSEAVEFAGRKMHMPGTIIGKALEPLAKGKGEILVLLSLQ